LDANKPLFEYEIILSLASSFDPIVLKQAKAEYAKLQEVNPAPAGTLSAGTCPVHVYYAPVLSFALLSGHTGVTRAICDGFETSRFFERRLAEARVRRGFGGWCREGESNPQGPKPGGF
jgi:hypothetical protein